MNKKLVGSLVVGLALVLGTSANLSAKSNNPDTGYTAKDKEFYLTEAQVAFIRPGLEFELLSFDIPADLQPVAEFTIKDEGGLPLDMDGVYTLGDVDIRFMLTYIPDGEEQSRKSVTPTDPEIVMEFTRRFPRATTLTNSVLSCLLTTIRMPLRHWLPSQRVICVISISHAITITTC